MSEDRPQYCPHCGAPAPDRGSFCSECGENLSPGADERDFGDGAPPVQTTESSRVTDSADVTWVCADCGREHHTNNPPCNNCGGMNFETVPGNTERATTSQDTGGGLPIPRWLAAIVVVIGAVVLASFLLGVVSEAGQSTTAYQEFEQDLSDTDVDTRAVGAEDRRWVVEMYSDRGDFPVISADVSTVAQTYVETAPSDGDHQRLDIIVYGAGDSRITELSIDADTAQAVRDGELSDTAFSERLANKIVAGAAR